MLNPKGSTLMWTGPETRVQTTPIIPEATYRPEFNASECDAIRTGKCPLEDVTLGAGSACGEICQRLLAGEIPAEPVILQYDFTRDLAIFKEGGRHLACVYAHIVSDHPDLEVPTEVKNCRIYTEDPEDILLLTKGSWTYYYGSIPALIKRAIVRRELIKNSSKSKFSFPSELARKEIIYAHGKRVVKYDTTWTVINPESAYDSEYAYLSYMHHFTENWPAESRDRQSIYFTNEASQMKAYEELKAFDPYWVPGTTDKITEDAYCVGEPKAVASEKG